MDEQDLAYENAVVSAWADESMARDIEDAFLQRDMLLALRNFRASEHWARIVRLLRAEGVEPGARVLDLGGGRGLVSASLALAGYRPLLCEPNPSDVCGAGAAARLAEQIDTRFEVHNGFVGELEQAAFDVAICRAVLHHIHPMAPVLEDVLGALKPGGVFIASDEPTIRRPADLKRVIDEHPFVPFGVEEWAGPVSHYRQALADAGFTRIKDEFPVAFTDYRTTVRPDLNAPLATAGYLRYRLRSVIRPRPPESRAFIARRPSLGLD